MNTRTAAATAYSRSASVRPPVVVGNHGLAVLHNHPVEADRMSPSFWTALAAHYFMSEDEARNKDNRRISFAGNHGLVTLYAEPPDSDPAVKDADTTAEP